MICLFFGTRETTLATRTHVTCNRPVTFSLCLSLLFGKMPSINILHINRPKQGPMVMMEFYMKYF